jgi:hypothetical protein
MPRCADGQLADTATSFAAAGAALAAAGAATARVLAAAAALRVESTRIRYLLHPFVSGRGGLPGVGNLSGPGQRPGRSR